jgi:uncharacterized membrane protein
MRCANGGLQMSGGRTPASMVKNTALPHEPRWHASLAVIAALALYMALPERLTIGPLWVAPALVLGLLVPLSILVPRRHRETRRTRFASILLIAVVNFFNVASIFLLIYAFLHPSKTIVPTASDLLLHGMEIWLTNILVFALWFWELDGGGPDTRAHATAAIEVRDADFLFPQMGLMVAGGSCDFLPPTWKPMFLDYLYVAFTNSTAFSPADTMPLSILAKMLMLLESLISLVTIAVVIARAISLIQ